MINRDVDARASVEREIGSYEEVGVGAEVLGSDRAHQTCAPCVST